MRYLNHAGTSYPKPEAVHEAVRRALALPPDAWGDAYESAFAAVRSEFPTEGNLLVTSGCTAALALAFSDISFAPGDVVVTSALEHHALERQLQSLQMDRGVVVHRLNYPSMGDALERELQSVLASEKVKLVALTAASNITGQRLPLARIGSRCREAQVPLLIDAAQTFGTDAFEATRLQGDIIVAAGHKAALGPQGIGLLFARPGVSFACKAAVCEVGEAGARSFPGFCDAGSVNLAGLCGLAAGLEFTRGKGRSALGRRLESWAVEARRALQEASEFELLGSLTSEDGSSPVVSFVPRTMELNGLAEAFRKLGVFLRVGTHCAPVALEALGHPDGCARISWGALSDEDDLHAFLAALRELDQAGAG